MDNEKASLELVSLAAVIRVVTRHATLMTSDDPNNGCEGDYTGASTRFIPFKHISQNEIFYI